MPIADPKLQPWNGQRSPQPLRWTVIARHEIRNAWKRKGTALLCRFCWILAAFWIFIFYLAHVVSNNEAMADIDVMKQIVEQFLTIQPEDYFDFALGWQATAFPLAVFLAISVGCGLIALDMKNQVLALYLSRALSPWDYIMGKGSCIAFYVASVTLVPGVLFYILNAVLREEWSMLWRNAWMLAAILAYGIIFVISITLIVLALSSLHKSVRLSAVTAIGFFYLSHIAYLLLDSVLVYYDAVHNETVKLGHWGWLSIQAVWQTLAAALFKQELPADIGVTAAAASLIGLCLLCLFVLKLRVRALEVVK